MPRRKDPNPAPAYRPQKPIDWAIVDKMMAAGCPGTEIAGACLMHYNTFYERFKIEKGVGFSEYFPMADDGGKAWLRLRQYTSAMNGNTKMLDKLGDERLGQGKKNSDLPPNEGELKDLHTALKKDLPPNGDQLKELNDSLHESLNGEEEKSSPHQSPDDSFCSVES